jgi:ribosomal protein S12 methylthiotransferase
MRYPTWMQKTFYIENLGCFRNQVDAEYILSSMEQSGYTHVADSTAAQTIVVNTCGFIESAKEQSIGSFFELRQANPAAKIVLAGCLAERYGDELLTMVPEADGVFGNKAPELLPQIMPQLERGERVSFFPQELTTAPRRTKLLSHSRSAFLKIAEGCIHHCTFCAIPKIRGPLASRTPDEVLIEFDDLLARGIFEINLIAQDLASFGKEQGGDGALMDLLRRMLERPGHFWIRPFYIHPDTFPEGLIELMQSDSRLIPYFDLPFQHADARILKMMARYGSKDQYVAMVNRIRQALPDAVIRSTFLVGFPGEDSAAFNQLAEFQEAAQIDWMGVFEYSREEQTSSFRLQSDTDFLKTKAAARRRRMALEKKQQTITEARLDRWVGRTLEMLVEESVVGSNLYLARAFLQAPEVDGLVVLHALGDAPLSAGAVVRARVTGRNGIDLEALQLAD